MGRHLHRALSQTPTIISTTLTALVLSMHAVTRHVILARCPNYTIVTFVRTNEKKLFDTGSLNTPRCFIQTKPLLKFTEAEVLCVVIAALLYEMDLVCVPSSPKAVLLRLWLWKIHVPV